MAIAVAGAHAFAEGGDTTDNEDVLIAANDVVWTTHSNIARDSMPVGNGDIGINVWTEENGDLLVYLGKTDAFDAQCRLLKLGRLRIHFSNDPFAKGKPFRQHLCLKDGTIRITAGESTKPLEISLWVDANRPVVHVDVKSPAGFKQMVSLEMWRTEKKSLWVFNKRDDHSHGVDGMSPSDPPYQYPDTLVPLSANPSNRIVWYHRNVQSMFPVSVKHQGLLPLPVDIPPDPLINRTFGAIIQGAGFVSDGPANLVTSLPRNETNLTIVPLTEQCSAPEDWIKAASDLQQRVLETPLANAFTQHGAWWSDFWKRSNIQISGGDATETAGITRGWHLNRFVTACNSRGNAPMKFNGGIFNVDGINAMGETMPRNNADARAWGPGYWNQNQRHIFWPMLEAGDYDQMLPFFKMYSDALPLAKHRVKTYYGHDGALYPETMYFWGTYLNDGDLGYGWQRRNDDPDLKRGCYRGTWPAQDPTLGEYRLAPGITQNPYIRRHWQGAVEVAAMMIRYYDHTRDVTFARDTLLPYADAVVTFYDQHFKRDTEGKIHFEPAQVLETYWDAVNPTPEIAGLRYCLPKMLALPERLVTSAQRNNWRRILSELPEIPTKIIQPTENDMPSVKVIANAGVTRDGRHNDENPNLWAIWPYLQHGVLGGDLKLAQDSYRARESKGSYYCWHSDNIFAAYAGMAKDAAHLLKDRYLLGNSCRFPTFYGRSHDWTPDFDNGGVCQNTIQSMLIQSDGDKIVLLPAWPVEWNAEFTLNVPNNTSVRCKVMNGKVTELKVSPESRQRDVIISAPYSM